MLRPLSFKILTVVWATVIVILSIVPTDGLPATFNSSDKVAHLGIYLVFGFLLTGTKWMGIRLAFLISILFGAGTELLQNYVPGRNPDLYDLVFNMIGAAFGVLIFKRLSNKILK